MCGKNGDCGSCGCFNSKNFGNHPSWTTKQLPGKQPYQECDKCGTKRGALCACSALTKTAGSTARLIAIAVAVRIALFSTRHRTLTASALGAATPSKDPARAIGSRPNCPRGPDTPRLDS